MQWTLLLPGSEVIDQDLGQRRRYILASLDDHANGGNQISRIPILAEITASPGAEQIYRILILGKTRQNQHRQLGLQIFDAPQRIDAVLIRHRYIKYYDIPVCVPDHGNGLATAV